MQTDIIDAAVRRRLAAWALQLRGVADGVESVGRELESIGVPHARLYARAAAERVDDLSRYLDGVDLSQLLKDVRIYASDHPAIVTGGAFGLGVVTARIIKAGTGE